MAKGPGRDEECLISIFSTDSSRPGVGEYREKANISVRPSVHFLKRPGVGE